MDRRSAFARGELELRTSLATLRRAQRAEWGRLREERGRGVVVWELGCVLGGEEGAIVGWLLGEVGCG